MPVYKALGEFEESRSMALGGSACVQVLEVEESRPTALEAACVCTSLRSRRGDGFGIIIAKTRGDMCYRHNLTREHLPVPVRRGYRYEEVLGSPGTGTWEDRYRYAGEPIILSSQLVRGYTFSEVLGLPVPV
jgi:hypothetical protein